MAKRMDEDPLRIQNHLVGCLSHWIETNDYPNKQVDFMEYVFAFSAALASESDNVQRFGYKKIRETIFPGLAKNKRYRERLLKSLRQRHNSPRQRIFTAPLLIILEDYPLAARRLVALQKDRNVTVRRRALLPLFQSERKRHDLLVQKALLGYFWDSDAEIREMVVRILSGRNRAKPEVFSEIVRIAADRRKSPNARIVAVKIIGSAKKFGTVVRGEDGEERKTRFPTANESDIGAYRALIDSLKSPNGELREVAAEAFDKINLGMKSINKASRRLRRTVEDSQLALVYALTDKMQPVRNHAASALGLHYQRERIGSEAVLLELLRLLDSDKSETRQIAATLVLNNRPRDLSVYLELLGVIYRRNSDREVNGIVSDTLREIHEKATRGFRSKNVRDREEQVRANGEEIAKHLTSSAPEVREYLLKIFIRRKFELAPQDPEIVAAIAANLLHLDEEVRDQARSVLAKSRNKADRSNALKIFDPQFVKALLVASSHPSAKIHGLARQLLFDLRECDKREFLNTLELLSKDHRHAVSTMATRLVNDSQVLDALLSACSKSLRSSKKP